jgi:hypothetical protein
MKSYFMFYKNVSDSVLATTFESWVSQIAQNPYRELVYTSHGCSASVPFNRCLRELLICYKIS